MKSNIKKKRIIKSLSSIACLGAVVALVPSAVGSTNSSKHVTINPIVSKSKKQVFNDKNSIAKPTISKNINISRAARNNKDNVEVELPTIPNLDSSKISAMYWTTDNSTKQTFNSAQKIIVPQNKNVYFEIKPKANFVFHYKDANQKDVFNSVAITGNIPSGNSNIIVSNDVTVASTNVVPPKTKTSNDGEITFALTDFSDATMNYNLSGGGTLDKQNHKITGLGVNSNPKLTFTFKNPSKSTWSSDPYKINNTIDVNVAGSLSTNIIGLAYPTKPTNISYTNPMLSTDKINITLPQIPANMVGKYEIFKKDGTTSLVTKIAYTNSSKVIANMEQGAVTKIYFTPATNYLWDSSAPGNAKYTASEVSFTYQHTGIIRIQGVDIPIVNADSTQNISAKSNASADATIGFILSTDFNPAKLDLFVDNGSLGTITKQSNNTYRGFVSGLTTNQQVSFSFKLKDPLHFIWNDKSTTDKTASTKLNAPTTNTVEVSQPIQADIKPTITYPNPYTLSNKPTITFKLPANTVGHYYVNLKTGGTSVKDGGFSNGDNLTQADFSQGDKITVKVTPANGYIFKDQNGSYTSTSVQSDSTITPANIIKYDDIVITNIVKTKPKSTTSKDGKIVFRMKNYDQNFMHYSTTKGNISITSNTKYDEITIYGIRNDNVVDFTVEFKNQNISVWKSNKKSDKFVSHLALAADMHTSDVEVNKEDINVWLNSKGYFSGKIIDPEASVSVTLPYLPFGTIGKYKVGSSGLLNTFTSNQTINNLKQGDSIFVSISLKPNYIFKDNNSAYSKNPSKGTGLIPKDNLTGIAVPTLTFSNPHSPSITTSNDGSIEISISNWDKSKMQILHSLNGTIEFDGSGKPIKIIGLTNADLNPISNQTNMNIQVTVSLKDPTQNKWNNGKNGTLKDVKSYAKVTQATDIGVADYIGNDFDIVNTTNTKAPTYNNKSNVAIKLPLLKTGVEGEYQLQKKDSNNKWVDDGGPHAFTNDNGKNKVITGKYQNKNVLVNIKPSRGYRWNQKLDKSVQTNSLYITTFSSKIVNNLVTAQNPQVDDQPLTTTSNNGKISFTLNNFDSQKMTLTSVDSQGDSLGTLSSTNDKITGLRDGDHPILRITLKNPNNNVWKGSVSGSSIDITTLPSLSSANIGIDMITSRSYSPSFSHPQSNTDKITVTFPTMTNSNLDGYYMKKGDTTKHAFTSGGTFGQIGQGEEFKLIFKPKQNFLWENNATPNYQYKNKEVLFNYTTPKYTFWIKDSKTELIQKPQFNFSSSIKSVNPHTDKSKDGEVSFSLPNGFDVSNFKITSDNGELHIENNKHVTIKNVKSDEDVNLILHIVKNKIWQDTLDKEDLKINVTKLTHKYMQVNYDPSSKSLLPIYTKPKWKNDKIKVTLPKLPEHLYGNYELSTNKGLWKPFDGTGTETLENLPQGIVVNLKYTLDQGYVMPNYWINPSSKGLTSPDKAVIYRKLQTIKTNISIPVYDDITSFSKFNNKTMTPSEALTGILSAGAGISMAGLIYGIFALKGKRREKENGGKK